MARKARKIKDKWKEKKWVNVVAPDSFNNVNIGYVPITDDENAKGRILEVTLWDILKGDPSQHQYKIIFQIDEVNDTKAYCGTWLLMHGAMLRTLLVKGEDGMTAHQRARGPRHFVLSEGLISQVLQPRTLISPSPRFAWCTALT